MRIHPITLALAIPLALGCWQQASASPSSEVKLSAEALQQLAELRSMTAVFHDFQNAEDMGWDYPLTNCFENPEGGMGYHYGNLGLLGDGAVDAMQPEAMLYEPQKNGSLRFVAVEYIILGSVLPSDTPIADVPSLFGQKLQWDEDDKVWELHVWLWRENPNGLFYEWNPKVSCKYATD